MVVVDAHVHFWDPERLHYPWLSDLEPLRRAFLPADYVQATHAVPIASTVVVEANVEPLESAREVGFFASLDGDAPIRGIVAFVDLTDRAGAHPALERLRHDPRVKGVRHNIQGQPRGFCLQPAFIEGVREVGRQGLTFDICITHDQLKDAIDLVSRCGDTAFVLDHCAKPSIRDNSLEPWRSELSALAAHENVCCKLSGLLTEAGPGWCDADIRPYADAAVEAFGTHRLIYGSDWPVLGLAGAYDDWFGFVSNLAREWTPDERTAFFSGNATRVYDL